MSSVQSHPSTLRIGTYLGSVNDLVAFVNQVWTHTYAGRMTIPCWTNEFFEWQFRLAGDYSRQNLIAAYDGAVLAGVLLGMNYSMKSPAGVHVGSQWSWLSIHPDYRNRGLAKALDQERITRQKAIDSRVIVSYRYVGSPHSLAERPRKESHDEKFNRKVGWWARVLNADRFSRWHWSRTKGLLSKLVSPILQIPGSAKNDPCIRPFASFDLDACLRLAMDAFSHATLSIAWDHDTLRHQLFGHEISQTLVLEEGGHITGFVNFHLLDFRAKTIEKVAILDLIVFGKAASRNRRRLLYAALTHMQDQGAILALKVRCGDVPSWPMLRTGFFPEASDSFLVLQSVVGQLEIPSASSVHVLWR